MLAAIYLILVAAVRNPARCNETGTGEEGKGRAKRADFFKANRRRRETRAIAIRGLNVAEYYLHGDSFAAVGLVAATFKRALYSLDTQTMI